jgi:hypothetical protein
MKTEKLKMKSTFFKYNVKLWYSAYRVMSRHLRKLQASSNCLINEEVTKTNNSLNFSPYSQRCGLGSSVGIVTMGWMVRGSNPGGG